MEGRHKTDITNGRHIPHPSIREINQSIKEHQPLTIHRAHPGDIRPASSSLLAPPVYPVPITRLVQQKIISESLAPCCTSRNPSTQGFSLSINRHARPCHSKWQQWCIHQSAQPRPARYSSATPSRESCLPARRPDTMLEALGMVPQASLAPRQATLIMLTSSYQGR